MSNGANKQEKLNENEEFWVINSTKFYIILYII